MVENRILPDTIQNDLLAISNIPAVTGILKVICNSTGLGFAAVARVTDKHWIACSTRDDIGFGLQAGDELELVTTICNEIRQHQQPVIIDNVSKDPAFYDHHTPAMYGFQSYISIPIFRKNGDFFGTLCAIDPHPAKLNTPETIEMFQLFADLIAFHLNVQEQLEMRETELKEEQQTAELREQFIAVLGHDLRNPLGAITSGAQVLGRMSFEDKARKFIDIIQNSAYRIQALVDNMLDLARVRLGDGISLTLQQESSVEGTLSQVINELRLLWPQRTILSDFKFDSVVTWDSKRIAQLFSNLLGNALIHGSPGEPITIKATCNANRFVLSVANAGEPIPAATMERLFHPFSRGEVKPGQQGLGLGLFIAQEIAQAHGGELTVVSTPEETVFEFSMPITT